MGSDCSRAGVDEETADDDGRGGWLCVLFFICVLLPKPKIHILIVQYLSVRQSEYDDSDLILVYYL
jgi:hypothetical protein